ncbi:hypothetical protein F4810DRAFT_670841 [Camillea tinctor]|nr:hypothetical protein F4810DRAFT_670841 [Camillea tinctor]
MNPRCARIFDKAVDSKSFLFFFFLLLTHTGTSERRSSLRPVYVDLPPTPFFFTSFLFQRVYAVHSWHFYFFSSSLLVDHSQFKLFFFLLP